MNVSLEDLVRIGELLADGLQSDKINFVVDAAKIVADLLAGIEAADTNTAKAAEVLYAAVAVQERIVVEKLQKIVDAGD